MENIKPYGTQECKRDQVRRMFDNIAPTYDRLNHLLSFNIDRWWRRRTVEAVRRTGARRILDLATGTGDLAIAMARRIGDAQIVGADLSPEMLAEAQRKVEAAGLGGRIRLQVCDAEQIPLADGEMDAATVSFGIRNFADPARGLAEMHRVVREGGHLAILEFANPRNRFVRMLYRIYSHGILPAIGSMVSRDRSAYEYLPASVDAFPEPERFAQMIGEAGFGEVEIRPLSFGIANIYTARKVQPEGQTAKKELKTAEL